MHKTVRFIEVKELESTNHKLLCCLRLLLKEKIALYLKVSKYKVVIFSPSKSTEPRRLGVRGPQVKKRSTKKTLSTIKQQKCEAQ